MTGPGTITPADAPAPTASVTTSAGRAPAPRAMAAIRLLIALAAAAPIGVYLWIALHRLGYPYELDWMEGGSVELAARVVAGHSLYVVPSLHFVGWTYTPLYYWLAAAVAKVTGVGFFTLRLVSVVASIVSMTVLARMVTRDGADRIAGLVAAGLFAAAFVVSGAWFDTGRVDSLFVALTLVTLAWGLRARSRRDGLVFGALAFLAFFTKQTALVALVPALTLLLVTRRRVALPALATLAVLVLGSTLLLDATSDGWYRFYVFSELAGQPWAPGEWVQFWTRDILGHEWPLVVLAGAGAVAGVRPKAKRRAAMAVLSSPVAYLVVASVGLIVAALISRVHTGGYANVLIPAYAATALLAGLACAELLRTRRPIINVLVAGVLLLQLGLLAYPIGAQIPTAADRAAGAELLQRLRGLRGPVIVLRHPWYATVTGHGSFAQGEGITDVLRSANLRGATVLRASLPGALDADHIQAVVLDGGFDAHVFGPQLTREFHLVSGPITRRRLYPLTDVLTAPTLLYVRDRPAP
ncbi:MAG: glycosyltransferase family 39 protein [Solirubrobacteraceae bacterium]